MKKFTKKLFKQPAIKVIFLILVFLVVGAIVITTNNVQVLPDTKNPDEIRKLQSDCADNVIKKQQQYVKDHPDWTLSVGVEYNKLVDEWYETCYKGDVEWEHRNCIQDLHKKSIEYLSDHPDTTRSDAAEYNKMIDEGTASCDKQFPTPTSDPFEPDRRSCVPGEIANTFDESFFMGKMFKSFALSGEWGTFAENHKMPYSWGLDYAGPNDDRPSSGIGEWYLENKGDNFQLKTTDSIGINKENLTDFKFYKYNNDIFAIPVEYRGFVVGPSQEAIDNFYNEISNKCR